MATAQDQETQTGFGVRRDVIAAVVTMVALIGGGGVWAMTANLSGAVIGQGTIVVEKSLKKIQHLDGGIVRAINVKDGDKVKAGDLLVRLDDTQLKAELAVIETQLLELAGRRIRLTAERDGQTSLVFPPSFDSSGKEAADVKTGEISLFNYNRTSRASQSEQLRHRIDQVSQEIKGFTSQRAARQREFEFVSKELDQLRTLRGQNLVTMTRLYAMEREGARIDGERSALGSQVARAEGQISELRQQLMSMEHNVRTESQRELRALDARFGELIERQVAARDKLSRVEIKAPQDGIVHELAIHTMGGVITAAAPIMYLVPADERLTIEAKFSPMDIDQVALGQPARLRFSALNQRTTPEFAGKVAYVAGDATVDSRTGNRYFNVKLELEKREISSLGSLKITPGMPVEAFVMTGDRTAISYFMKPLTDQFQRAFREE